MSRYLSVLLFRSREGDFDNILDAVADDLATDEHIEHLGKELGIGRGDIDRCIQTNRSGPHVTSRGTRRMLRDWSQGKRKRERKDQLSAALKRARLVRIADEHLCEGIYLVSTFLVLFLWSARHEQRRRSVRKIQSMGMGGGGGQALFVNDRLPPKALSFAIAPTPLGMHIISMG